MGWVKQIIILFVIWRLLLLTPLLFGSQFLPYKEGSDYTNLWKFTKSYPPVDSIFLYPWANFDGVHYLNIAGNGYAGDGSNARFFPLYPLLIRFFSLNQGEAYGALQFFSALFVSNASFLLALIFLYKLIRINFSHNIAMWTVVFLLVFPTSFYFVSVYSESLFLLLTVLVFYLIAKKKWADAGICAILLNVTRPTGIAIFPALLYYYIKTKKIPLLLAPLGIIGYALFNLSTFSDPLLFLKAHTEIGTSRSFGIVLFPQTIFRYAKILTTASLNFEWYIALLEISTFIFAAILLYVGFKRKINPSYLLYGLFAFSIPALSGTFTGFPRYALLIFPIFLTLALLLPKKIKYLYFLLSSILLFILLMFFSRGYFIA